MNSVRHTSSHMYDDVPVEARFLPLIVCHADLTMGMVVKRIGAAELTPALEELKNGSQDASKMVLEVWSLDLLRFLQLQT